MRRSGVRSPSAPPSTPKPSRVSASAQSNLETAPHAWAGHQLLVPALDVREIAEIDLVALVPPRPAEDRKIRDRNASAGKFDFAKPPVEHAVESSRFLRVALQAIAPVLLVGDLQEMMHLAGHRTKAAHLPHQPFEHRDLMAQIRGPELTRLLAEIDQDRAGFEYADPGAAGTLGIDDRRDLAVGADPDKGRGELLSLGDVYRLHRIRQAHLFECHTYLAAVRSVPGVKFDGHRGRPSH